MRIAIVSDTHRDYNAINEAAKAAERTDMLIHLGDNVVDVNELEKKYNNRIVSVRGNCDFSPNTPLEIIEEVNGVKILVTHGHKYNVKNGLLQLKYRAEELGANIALFGHTHASAIVYEDGIWLINPGSASLPRDRKKSIAIIEIKDGKVIPTIQSI